MMNAKAAHRQLLGMLTQMQDGTRIVCTNLPPRLGMGARARGTLCTDGGNCRWIEFDEEPEFRVLLGALTADVVVIMEDDHDNAHGAAAPAEELRAVI